MMNGIGGSGDFTRNAYLSIYMCPSISKGGRISTIVPMATHVDHNEHSVQIVVTEQGLADLRGLGTMERARGSSRSARTRPTVTTCGATSRRRKMGHIKHDLRRAFELHRNLTETGSMLPDVRV